jgi:site-specific DNA-methyltransferase (adenine-specific)
MDKLIEQGVKVDAIITDPPYGTTACKRDSVIPFEQMWERLNKLIKPN